MFCLYVRRAVVTLCSASLVQFEWCFLITTISCTFPVHIYYVSLTSYYVAMLFVGVLENIGKMTELPASPLKALASLLLLHTK